MKRTRSIQILSIMMSLLIVIGIIALDGEPVWAGSDASTGLEYSISNGKASITGFTAPAGFGGALTIPGTLGGASVTAIYGGAFFMGGSLKSITIPQSVVSIGSGAFSSCTNLTSISVDASNTAYKSNSGILYSKDGTKIIRCPSAKAGSVSIPSGVLYIMQQAFLGCAKVTDITIPGSVTGIGDYAFKDCTSLTSINIPLAVSSISLDAFIGCSRLAGIHVDAANLKYKSIDGIWYSKNGTVLICCPGGKSGSITIPDGVVTILEGAFSSCYLVTGISIPGSVTGIQEDAFLGCSRLQSLRIPAGVTIIGEGAFNFCTDLSKITVDEANTVYKSVDDILYSKDETKIICCPAGRYGSVVIPDSVTCIGNDAFFGCGSLTDISIPKSVTSIGTRAFYQCFDLTSIAIPSGVTSIADSAFFWCSNLKDVYFYGNAPTLGTDVFETYAAGFTVHYLSTSTGFSNPWYGYTTVPFTAQGSVSYQTHVQDIGWQDYVSNGAASGTSGQSKRLEAIRIKLDGVGGGIEYRTHVQDYGWQGWVQNDALSGTSGESKRLEAIQIRLTGEAQTLYDVYYRVHAQNFGWMDWARNGDPAGTAGYSYRLEATEIVLVKKGDPAPGPTAAPFVENGKSAEPTGSSVNYRTHVQDIGWMGYVANGTTSGTSGQAKRMEGIQINLQNAPGGIRYRTHVQDYGWMDWVSDDALSGTSGESKRLEAIQINLTGDAAILFDVYYRVHAQNFGWMGWAMNGYPAGTAGFSYRLEAIEVVLVPKGGPAPGSTDNAFVEA